MHVEVKLVICLLHGASTAGLLLLGRALGGTSFVVVVVLVSSSRLRLWLGLAGTLSERLDSGNDFVGLSSTNNDFDFDGAVVNQKSIQLLESLAGAILFVEGDVGNTTALRVRTVGKLDLLDGADGLNEVFLSQGTMLVNP